MKIFALLLVSAVLLNAVLGLSHGSKTLLQTIIQSLQKVYTPYATHMSEESAKSAGSGTYRGINYYSVYSGKFQPFSTDAFSNRGILNEEKEYLKPLLNNSKLHSAFLKYVSPPSIIQKKLPALIAFLLEHRNNTLRTNKPITATSNNEDIDGILRMLSQDVKVQLDEVTSLIVTSKAVVKFPRQLVTKMTKLKDNNRQQLIELIGQIPLSADRFTFPIPRDFWDSHYFQPFMKEMGFTVSFERNSNGNFTVSFAKKGKSEDLEDILIAGQILLLVTKKPTFNFANNIQ